MAWLRLRWSDLQFAEARNTLLLFFAIGGAAAVALLFRHARTRRRPGDTVRGASTSQAAAAVVLPAIVPSMRRSPLSIVRLQVRGDDIFASGVEERTV